MYIELKSNEFQLDKMIGIELTTNAPTSRTICNITNTIISADIEHDDGLSSSFCQFVESANFPFSLSISIYEYYICSDFMDSYTCVRCIQNCISITPS